MRKRFDRSSLTPHCRRGTTLIEVLAGLVILGTLLVSVSVARGRFLRQWAAAHHPLSAVRATDVMLARWLAGPPQNVPLHGQGTLDGAPNCVWATRVVTDSASARLGALVVRVEVFDRSAGVAREPLFQVEFLLHDYRRAKTPQPVASGG